MTPFKTANHLTAWAAVRSRNTGLSNWYWSNVKRLGEKKAITAVARKLLVYIYAMLKSGELYDDSLDVADTERRKAEKLDSAHKIVAHQSCSANTQEHRGDTRQSSQVCTADTSQSSDRDQAGNVPKAADKSEPPRKRGRPRK